MIQKNKISLAADYFNHAYKSHIKGNLYYAIKSYQKSIEIYPTPKAYTFLGWAYSLQGNYDKAIEECKNAIEIDPEYANPYNDIGSYFISLGNYDEALSWLEKAIDTEDSESLHYPYYNLGRVYEKKGDWLIALRYYNFALSVNNNYKLAEKAAIRLISKLN